MPSAIGAALGVLAANRSPPTASRAPARPHRAARARQLRAGRRRRAARRRPPARRPELAVIVSSRAPLRVAGRAGVPGPAAARARGRHDATSRDRATSEAVRLFARARRRRSGPASRSPPRTPPTSPRSCAASTACRWRSSSPPPGPGSSRRRRWRAASTTGWACSRRGGRDLPARQRTLRGAIDWSHDLLDAASGRLFARLSVFSGGGTIETAEEVCVLPDDAGDGADRDVLTGSSASRSRAWSGSARTRTATSGSGCSRPSASTPPSGSEAGETRRRLPRPPRRRASSRSPRRRRPRRRPPRLRSTSWRRSTTTSGRPSTTRSRPATASARRAGVRALWRFWHMRGHVVEGRRRVDPVLAMTAWPDAPSRGPAAGARGGRRPRLLGGRHARPRALRGGRARGAPPGRRRRARQRALQPLVHAPAHATSATGRTPARRRGGSWTRRSRSGPPGRRGRDRRCCGPSASTTLRRGPRGAATITRAPARSSRREDQFWIAWCRFTRAVPRDSPATRGRRPRHRPRLREFEEPTTCPGMVLVAGRVLEPAAARSDARRVPRGRRRGRGRPRPAPTSRTSRPAPVPAPRRRHGRPGPPGRREGAAMRARPASGAGRDRSRELAADVRAGPERA